jgi:hypothetical protein
MVVMRQVTVLLQTIISLLKYDDLLGLSQSDLVGIGVAPFPKHLSGKRKSTCSCVRFGDLIMKFISNVLHLSF